MNLQKAIDGARKKLREMRGIEKGFGLASPEDLPFIDHLRTAAAAIEAGIVTEDFECVAEGLVMLQDAIGRQKNP